MATPSGGWGKSPPELVAHFGEMLATIPQATVRKMFGYPAAFANGYMFTSLFEDRWIIRLPIDGLDELAALGGTEFAPMPGRPMRGYLALPATITADDETLRPWLERALAHVTAMPPKKGR